MSHIVQIQTQVRDGRAVQAACTRLKLPAPTEGSFQLFGTAVSGLGIQLPGWKYPVVCQLPLGQVQYDNYAGRWGKPAELDRFLQAYAVEKATLEARLKGYSVQEQQLTDGSVKLTIQVTGGVA